MKNIYVGLLAAVACTYSLQAAANLVNDNNLNLVFTGENSSFSESVVSPEISLNKLSAFNPNNSVKLAAVCSVGGGGCAGLTFGSSDNSMDLDGATQCDDEGYVKSCPEGKVPDENNRCPHNKSYFKCRDANTSCDDGYSKSACNSTTQVQTASYKNTCTNTCYQCRNKTCAEGGYAASITSCQNGTPVSFAGNTCYKNVTAKTCENGGYKSSVPTNNKCTAVTYCSKTCQSNCYQPTCEEGGYKSSVPTNNICTDVAYYGRTCKKDCYQPTCDYNNSGYKSGIPTNQVCTPVSYYGRTCYKDCYQPQCSAGGYIDAVPTNNKCTPVTYYGRNCQKDCYQPQCTEGGYLASCPAEHTCTSQTYYGRTCYTDNGASETEITCKFGSILYKDLKCYSKTKKTPIGVVIDNLNKRAIALDEIRITSTLRSLALHSIRYGNQIGVPGWDWATLNDLNLMKENFDALNAVLNTISGAKPLDKDNDGYVGGEAVNFKGEDIGQINRCLRELKGIDPESGKYDFCLVSVGYDADLSSSDHRVRLVLFYGDCGSYKTSIPTNQKCTSVIYNGNTCYKDCRAYTCSDGGYQSSNKFQCATGTLTSVSYKGLTCYHCVGTSTPKPIEECEDYGYLTPGSTAACACTYGNKPVTATTSSGTKLSCVRCGTSLECGNSSVGFQCLKCHDKADADPVNPL